MLSLCSYPYKKVWGLVRISWRSLLFFMAEARKQINILDGLEKVAHLGKLNHFQWIPVYKNSCRNLQYWCTARYHHTDQVLLSTHRNLRRSKRKYYLKCNLYLPNDTDVSRFYLDRDHSWEITFTSFSVSIKPFSTTAAVWTFTVGTISVNITRVGLRDAFIDI